MPLNPESRIIVIGAGHGGGAAASFLRQSGFQGQVLLIGNEPVAPYHRPPLSKKFEPDEQEQLIKPADFYREQNIELRLGVDVTGIEPDNRTVELATGELLGYDALILATGAVARKLPLPGVDLGRVYELRNLDHARGLKGVVQSGMRLAIIGGGWIGLEVAAAAGRNDIHATVIERESGILARVASPALAEHVADKHRQEGTTLITDANVAALNGDDSGNVAAVELGDGSEIACDAVLVAVGAEPDTTLAQVAGLDCEGGVPVDEHAATALPGIYAIGDMTLRPLHYHDGHFRMESIPSAVEQARQAVAHILGQPAPSPEVPWFWSDQFDLGVKIAGLRLDADTEIVRGEAGGEKIAIFHAKGGRLLAVEAVNDPQAFMHGKRLIRNQEPIDTDRLRDVSQSLQSSQSTTAEESDEWVLGGVEGGNAPGSAEPETGELDPLTEDADPRVVFITSDGEQHVVEMESGISIMNAAMRNNVPGIVAECGGSCACATCHVHVDPQWLDNLDEPAMEETDLLECLESVRNNSRLSCQLLMRRELDGIVIHVPAFQE